MEVWNGRFRSLMGQWATARFERFRRLGCLRSLRAHWHLMGSAGCRATRLKSQSASETACYRIGAVICLLPGRRSARELGWTSVSMMPPSLCGFELGAVSQHGMHDDREATGE